MFGKIIYYDKKTVDEYKSLINGQRQVEIDQVEVSNATGASMDLKVLNADKKASKSYIAKIMNSLLFECDEFEKMLADREDYFDFTQGDFDLSTILPRSIIKINGFIEIPEQFDLMQMVDKFKPFLMGSIDFEGQADQSGAKAMKMIFENAKATKIPVIVDEASELSLCAKLNSNNLIMEYEEFDEYLDNELTILARVSSGIVEPNKPFYDPLRDFISINRALRRNLGNRSKELEPLITDSKYRQIDILGIYQ